MAFGGSKLVAKYNLQVIVLSFRKLNFGHYKDEKLMTELLFVENEVLEIRSTR